MNGDHCELLFFLLAPKRRLADPLSALVVAAIAVREGLASWRGEGCCASW